MDTIHIYIYTYTYIHIFGPDSMTIYDNSIIRSDDLFHTCIYLSRIAHSKNTGVLKSDDHANSSDTLFHNIHHYIIAFR